MVKNYEKLKKKTCLVLVDFMSHSVSDLKNKKNP